MNDQLTPTPDDAGQAQSAPVPPQEGRTGEQTPQTAEVAAEAVWAQTDVQVAASPEVIDAVVAADPPPPPAPEPEPVVAKAPAADAAFGPRPEPIRREVPPAHKREGPTVYEMEVQTQGLTKAKADVNRLTKVRLKDDMAELAQFRKAYPEFDWRAAAAEEAAEKPVVPVISAREQALADKAADSMARQEAARAAAQETSE